MSTKIWLKERFPIDYEKFVDLNEKLFIKEPIPLHMKKWFLAMGTTPFILFPIQIVTGILLAFYFVPSPELAHESVRFITEEVRLGYWVRGFHHWGANLMIISIFLHMMRVFFTQSYRKPREINWVLGLLLLLLSMTISFTGYSLTYSQVSFWATTVGTNMLGEVPLIGTALRCQKWLNNGSASDKITEIAGQPPLQIVATLQQAAALLLSKVWIDFYFAR